MVNTLEPAAGEDPGLTNFPCQSSVIESDPKTQNTDSNMFFIHRQIHDPKKAHWSNIYEERSKRLNILISSSPTPESNWFRFCNSFWTRSISLHEVQTLDPELLSRRNRCHMLSRHQCDTHTLNSVMNITNKCYTGATPLSWSWSRMIIS